MGNRNSRKSFEFSGPSRAFVIIFAILFSAASLSFAAQPPGCVEGWTLELVAAAPEIKHPSVVCSAPDGRVFVAEDPMDISTPTADVAQGRIKCFHPDGRVTIFADNLFAVFGMQYIDGYLYVLHNPKFSRFRDDAGIGKDRLDLIEHTHPRPWDLNWNDHVPANFRLAMDGYLYIAVGDKGLFGAVGSDSKRLDMRGGGIVRMRPDGSELEVYCTGVRNILDIAMDAEGEIFTYDNTDEHAWMGRFTHMVDGGFYGYPYDFQPQRPYTLWMMADFGGGAATGAFCYTEDALPAEYDGNMFLADFGKRQIMRVRVAREGATFRVLSREDMFIDPPGDFRPVGIALSADGGSIYVCDWNHTDTKDAVECGRLWRLSYAEPKTSTSKPRWFEAAASGKSFEATIDELMEGLHHTAASVRLVAQRRLSERNEQSRDHLMRLLCNDSASATARSHALWALDAIDAGEFARLKILEIARSEDIPLRRQAIRQLGARRVSAACSVLINALNDAHASIRFQAATALGKIGSSQALSALVEGLADQDLFVRYAMFNAINRIARFDPQLWPTIVEGLAHENERVREGIAFATRDAWDLELVEALAHWSADRSQTCESRAASLEILASKLYQAEKWNGEWWAYHPALKAPPAETVEWSGTARIIDVFHERVADESSIVRRIAVIGLRHAATGKQQVEQIKAVLHDTLTRETDGTVKQELLIAVGELQDAAAAPHVVATLSDLQATVDVQIAAIYAAQKIGGTELIAALTQFIQRELAKQPHAAAAAARALGELKAQNAVEPLVQLLHRSESDVQTAVLRALSDIGNADAIACLLRLLDSDSYQLREQVIEALGALHAPEVTQKLLSIYSRGEHQRAALDALARQPDSVALDAYLEGLASKDAELRLKCRNAIHAVRDAVRSQIEERLRLQKLSNEVVARLQEIYRDDAVAREGALFAVDVVVFNPSDYFKSLRQHQGNAELGRQLFHDSAGLGCAKCHVVNGLGGLIGPDLSSIGEQFDRLQLAEHVLYPSKSIREGYRQTHIILEDGRQFSGIVASETADELLLRDIEGREYSILKAEIETRSGNDQSLMPERIVDGISVESFADLLAYLESLRRRGAAK